jgi:hypothetical protein
VRRRALKSRWTAEFHSTSRAKRALLCVFTASFLGRRPPGPEPGLWWCKHRDGRGAEVENEAMPTKQTSKQRAKSKASAPISRGAANKPAAETERQPQSRNPRPRLRAAAAETNPTAATAPAARKARLNGSESGHDKPEPARASIKPVAEPTDLAASRVSGAEQPPASTKRAQLINLLERPEGALVAEIGQRLVGRRILCEQRSPACAKPVAR